MPCLLLLTHRFYEYAYVVVISTYRFLFAGPVAVASGFDYLEISLSLALGGFIGFVIFYFFSDRVIYLYRMLLQKNQKPPKSGWMKRYRKQLQLRRYGIPLLMVFGPSVLSIPLTAFIVRRWFRKTKCIIVYFCISVLSWAFIFGTLSTLNIV